MPFSHQVIYEQTHTKATSVTKDRDGCVHNRLHQGLLKFQTNGLPHTIGVKPPLDENHYEPTPVLQ
jgi:hypothetical protein